MNEDDVAKRQWEVQQQQKRNWLDEKVPTPAVGVMIGAAQLGARPGLEPMRLYISGPMSGLPKHNKPAFHHAEQMLKMTGLPDKHQDDIIVVNPAAHDFPANTEWHVCLRQDIHELVECNAIYMLRGWEASRGAQLEHHIAERLGMKIYFQE